MIEASHLWLVFSSILFGQAATFIRSGHGTGISSQVNCGRCGDEESARPLSSFPLFFLFSGRVGCPSCGRGSSRESLGHTVVLFFLMCLGAALDIYVTAYWCVTLAYVSLIFFYKISYSPSYITLTLSAFVLFWIAEYGGIADVESAIIFMFFGVCLIVFSFFIFAIISGKPMLGGGEFKVVLSGLALLSLDSWLSSIVIAGTVYLLVSAMLIVLKSVAKHPGPYKPLLEHIEGRLGNLTLVLPILVTVIAQSFSSHY